MIGKTKLFNKLEDIIDAAIDLSYRIQQTNDNNIYAVTLSAVVVSKNGTPETVYVSGELGRFRATYKNKVIYSAKDNADVQECFTKFIKLEPMLKDKTKLLEEDFEYEFLSI